MYKIVVAISVIIGLRPAIKSFTAITITISPINLIITLLPVFSISFSILLEPSRNNSVKTITMNIPKNRPTFRS